MTTSADIFQLVLSALIAPVGDAWQTDAQDRIRTPGDLATQAGDYPIIKLRLLSEGKQAIGHGTVMFTATATIRLIGEVSEPASISDVNISDAEANLWRLKQQAEIAIINCYPLFRVIQQLASVQSQLSYVGEKQVSHLAGFQSDYTFEFIQTGEDFAPIATTPIEEIQAELTNYPETPGFLTELPQ